MNLNLELSAAEGYKSASQRARVITEAWAFENMYCPACTADHLDKTRTGTEAVDFICSGCDSQFQLKAVSKPFGRKIVDAAYDAMMRAIARDQLPHFLLLSYDNIDATVKDLLIIPKFCLPKSAIEARKPLSPNARRAGWVGCNIVLDMVPPEGRINIINSGSILPKVKVRERFRSVQPLNDLSTKTRGWTLDVLTVLRSMNKSEFTLEDIYLFEGALSERHPENLHIREKIRQQLQVLRDLGYLQFIRRGFYRWARK